jgi:hypothetical protein
MKRYLDASLAFCVVFPHSWSTPGMPLLYLCLVLVTLQFHEAKPGADWDVAWALVSTSEPTADVGNGALLFASPDNVLGE